MIRKLLAATLALVLLTAATFPPAWMSITFYASSAVVFTNPTTFVEFNSATNRRESAWLVPFQECRCTIGGGVNGAAGTVGEAQYSTDGGTVWSTLATCPADAMTTLVQAGTWQTMPAASHAETLLRFGVSGGNGVADPSVSTFRLQCRHQ